MSIIDCDIHNDVPASDVLMPYLSDYLAEQFTNTRFPRPFEFDFPYPANSPLAVRGSERADSGWPTQNVVLRSALHADVEVGILLCTYAVDGLRNPDHAAGLARAVNDWQVAEWLSADPRLRASIVVPSRLPELAADEIERVGDHPGFVQVGLPARSHHPYGSRLYHPMWRAIERHDLVGAIYFGGAPGNPPTPVGWPSYFIEEYVAMASVFAAQVTSLVVEGTFDQFDSLRVTLVESGSSWLTSHMWRFDKEWKQLRLMTPWVRRSPSDYIREHIRLTTEPWDMPAKDERVGEFFDQLGSDEMVLFGSGYPHEQVGDIQHVLRTLPATTREKVTRGNAREWYRL